MDRYVYDYAKNRVLSLRSGKHLRSRHGCVYITTDDGQRRWVPVRDFLKVVDDVKQRTSFNAIVLAVLALSLATWAAVFFVGRVIAFAEREGGDDGASCGGLLLRVVEDDGEGRRGWIATTGALFDVSRRCCVEYGRSLVRGLRQ